jgi:hypothetical protein
LDWKFAAPNAAPEALWLPPEASGSIAEVYATASGAPKYSAAGVGRTAVQKLVSVRQGLSLAFSLFVDQQGAVGFSSNFAGACLDDPEHSAADCGGGKSPAKLVPPGRWTHVAATFDFREVRLFLDGHCVRVVRPPAPQGGRFGAYDAPLSSAFPVSQTEFSVGNMARSASSGGPGQGLLTCGVSDVRVYSRILTALELQALATGSGSPSPAGTGDGSAQHKLWLWRTSRRPATATNPTTKLPLSIRVTLSGSIKAWEDVAAVGNHPNPLVSAAPLPPSQPILNVSASAGNSSSKSNPLSPPLTTSWAFPRRGNSPYLLRMEFSEVAPDVRFGSDDKIRRFWHDNQILVDEAAAQGTAAQDRLSRVLSRDCHYPYPKAFNLVKTTHAAGTTTGFRYVNCSDPAFLLDKHYGCAIRSRAYKEDPAERYFDPSCCDCNSTSVASTCGALAAASQLQGKSNRVVCGAAVAKHVFSPAPPSCQTPWLDDFHACVGFAMPLADIPTANVSSACVPLRDALLLCLKQPYLVCNSSTCASPAATITTLDMIPQGGVSEGDYTCLIRLDNAHKLFTATLSLQEVRSSASEATGALTFRTVAAQTQTVLAKNAEAATGAALEFGGFSLDGKDGITLLKRSSLSLTYNTGNGAFADILAGDASTGGSKFIDKLRPAISTQNFRDYSYTEQPALVDAQAIRAALLAQGDSDGSKLLPFFPTGPFKNSDSYRTGFAKDATCARTEDSIQPIEYLKLDAGDPRPPQFEARGNLFGSTIGNISEVPYHWLARTNMTVDFDIQTRDRSLKDARFGGALGGSSTSPDEVISAFASVFAAARQDLRLLTVSANYIVDVDADTLELAVTVIGVIDEVCPGFLRVELRNEATRELESVLDVFVDDGSGECPMPFKVDYVTVIGTAQEYLVATGAWSQTGGSNQISNVSTPPGNSSSNNSLSNDTAYFASAEEDGPPPETGGASGTKMDLTGVFLYFTVSILDKRARVTVKPALGESQIVYAIPPTNRLVDQFKITDSQVQTLILCGAFLLFVILLWASLCCCALSVRKRTPFDLASDIRWRKNPIKKLSYMAQDLLPSPSQSSEFQSDKHSGVVLAIVVSGIARAVLFSFALFFLIILWVTADDVATLGQFPKTMNNTAQRVENVSALVDQYREYEFTRQRKLADNLTLECLGRVETLENVSATAQASRRTVHNNLIESCNIELLNAGFQRMIMLESESAAAAFQSALNAYEEQIKAQQAQSEEERLRLLREMAAYRQKAIAQHTATQGRLDSYKIELDARLVAQRENYRTGTAELTRYKKQTLANLQNALDSANKLAKKLKGYADTLWQMCVTLDDFWFLADGPEFSGINEYDIFGFVLTCGTDGPSTTATDPTDDPTSTEPRVVNAPPAPDNLFLDAPDLPLQYPTAGPAPGPMPIVPEVPEAPNAPVAPAPERTKLQLSPAEKLKLPKCDAGDAVDQVLFFSGIDPQGPKVDVPRLQSFTLSLPSVSLAFLATLGIIFILDILLMVRRIINVMAKAARAVEGDMEESEETMRVYSLEGRPLNFDPNAKRHLDDDAGGCLRSCFSLAQWISTRAS